MNLLSVNSRFSNPMGSDSVSAHGAEERTTVVANRKSVLRSALLGLAALSLAGMAAQAQLTEVHCGGLGDRLCTISDPEFFVSNTRNVGQACDAGLAPMPNPNNLTQIVCGNVARNQLANIFNTTDPRGFVLHEQEEAIGADVPLNLVNTVGTHNSYSNYASGGYHENYGLIHFDLSSLSFTTVEDPYAADQYYSISDQLNAGARTIRIDPYFYNGEMRVCHGPIDCTTTSDGRLFAYAVREVADWLKAHPGEFVIIGLNDYAVESQYQKYEDAAVTTYLGSMLYEPAAGQPHYLTENNTTVWPTLRQLRALGKQAMIFSNKYNSYGWYNNTYWTNDTSAKNLKAGQNLSLGQACLDDKGSDVRRRPILGWNNVGEDRSGSMVDAWKTSSFPFFAVGNSDGMMDNTATSIATKCGASVIDLDFWGALNHAFHFDVNVLGDNVTLVDFRGPDDTRALSASWSYIANDSFIGPAVLAEKSQQWVSQPAGASYRYACAAQRETPDVYDGLYEWEITAKAGPWSGGEAACQALGSQYHFWFPQSVYEQSNLLRYDLIHSAGLTGMVWLNYRSASYGKQLMTAPQQIALKVGAGQLPAPQTIWVSGGKGGKLRVISEGPFQAQQNMVNGWPTNEITLTPIAGKFNQVGTFTQVVKVEEQDPNTGALSYENAIPVTVTVADTLVPSTNVVTLTPGSEQTVAVRGFAGAAEQIPFHLGATPAWLVAEASESTTPAMLKFTAKPMPVGVYVASVALIPTGADAGDVPVSITVQYVVK
jgi:hypothetical protein